MNEVAALVLCTSMFYVLDRLVTGAALLPQAAYQRSSVTLAMLSYPRHAMVLLGVPLPAFVSWTSLEWSRLDPHDDIRPVIVIMALWLALSLGRVRRNPYYGRTYVVDRALLVILSGLVYVHPAFALLAVNVALVNMSQAMYPLAKKSSSILHMTRSRLPVTYFLLMFGAWIYGVLAGVGTPIALLELMLMGFGATYFWSAVGKIQLKWIQRNDLIGAVNTALAHRRLAIPKGLLFRVVCASLIRFNRPILFTVVVLETMGALLCVDDRLTIAALVALSLFQLVVSMLSGINFVAWSLVAMLLGVMTARMEPFAHQQLSAAAGTVALMILGGQLLLPLQVCWLDTRYCNVFRLYLVSDSDRRQLRAEELGAYYSIFEKSRFGFACELPLLVGGWGETDNVELAAALRTARCSADIENLESRYGRNEFDPEAAKRFDAFLTGYCVEYATLGYRRISVCLAKCLFDGESFRLLEEREVRSVTIG